MDSDRKEILYLNRASNELDLARTIFKISTGKKFKLDLELKEDSTFFSNVISNAYYCIFYSAKAFLYTKSIITTVPDEHRKTLDEFEKFAISGQIDAELLKIYKDIVVKAEELLGIFVKEKSKRGKFTYRKLPQANLEPAKESLENAEKFYKNINLLIREKNDSNTNVINNSAANRNGGDSITGGGGAGGTILFATDIYVGYNNSISIGIGAGGGVGNGDANGGAGGDGAPGYALIWWDE